MKEIKTTIIINKQHFMDDHHLISTQERFKGPEWLWS
jgi:hypothetical protein